MRIHISEVVPRRACPLGHGVGLAVCLFAAAGASCLYPVGHICEGRLTGVGGLVALYHRELQRQLGLGQRYIAAALALDDRDGLAPVALTGEHPVAQLEVDLLMSDALLGEELGDLLLSLINGQTVEDARVDHNAGGAVGERLLLDVAALDDLDDREVEFLRELPVAGIVSRYRHDSAGAVGDQNVVGDEDRYLSAVHGVDGCDALELHAGLVLVHLGALEVALLGGLSLISLDLVEVRELVSPLLDVRVLGGYDHVGGAVESIGTGGVYQQLVACGGVELDLRAVAPAYPVLLLELHALGIIHEIEIVDQAVGVLGDAEHPLALDPADDLAAAALAHAVDYLFVSKHALAGGAPVDSHLLFIGEVMLEQLQKDPLGPLVIVGVGGVDLAAPVERDT